MHVYLAQKYTKLSAFTSIIYYKIQMFMCTHVQSE